MKRRTLARRIAARQQLLDLAHDLAPFFERDALERIVRARAPEPARLVGDREVLAVVELAARPLGSG